MTRGRGRPQDPPGNRLMAWAWIHWRQHPVSDAEPAACTVSAACKYLANLLAQQQSPGAKPWRRIHSMFYEAAADRDRDPAAAWKADALVADFRRLAGRRLGKKGEEFEVIRFPLLLPHAEGRPDVAVIATAKVRVRDDVNVGQVTGMKG